MGGARVQGIACWWCDISNCFGRHVIVGLESFNDPLLGYLRRERFWFVSLSPSTPCPFLINILTPCLLLVDLGPLPLLKLK